MAYYLLDRTRRFPVTPKDEPPMSMREILSIGRWTVVMVLALSLGILLVNPVGLYYNVLWLIPFYSSPLVMYYFCGPRTAARGAANGGTRDLLGDPRLRTSLDSPVSRW